MTMTADLRDRLKAAGVAGGSVYRDERPQGSKLPAVIIYTVSDPRPSTYDGAPAGRETRVQVDCQASSRGAADEIAEAVITATAGPERFGGTDFSNAFVAAQRGYSDRPSALATTFVTSLDLLIWHQPAE